MICSRLQEAALMELTASFCTLRLMITPLLILLIRLTSSHVEERSIHADSLKEDAVIKETTVCSAMIRLKSEDEYRFVSLMSWRYVLYVWENTFDDLCSSSCGAVESLLSQFDPLTVSILFYCLMSS